MEKIRYFVKEGFRSIWVNRMMSLASILVLCVCLIMLGTTLLLSLNLNSFISQLESRNQVIVYLQNNLDQDKVTKAGDTINAIPNVGGSTFLSKQDIFNEAKSTLGNENILLSGIDSNAFDCAYQVKISDPSKMAQTTDALGKVEGVKYVRQDEGLASILSNLRHVVGLAGFWLFIIMAVVALFLISNTIKLALFSRKREINIMKYVGATNWFIRWPFIIEGVIIGILSGGVALFAQWYVYTKIISTFIMQLNVVKPLSYTGEMNIIVPGFLVAGIIVGALGSAVSVRKYLKV